MNDKKYSVVILVAALIIIGTRGVCLAQFSQHVESQTSAAQELNVVQVSTPFSHSTAVRVPRIVLGGSHALDQRIEGKFVFRVKRFVLARPTYRYFDTRRNSYEARSPFVVLLCSPSETFASGDRSFCERRIRHPLIDTAPYRS